MIRRTCFVCLAIALWSLLTGRPAAGYETISIRESRVPGEKFAVALVAERHDQITWKDKDGQATTSDVVYRQSLKLTMAIISERNGSPTAIRVFVEPNSEDSTREAGAVEIRRPSPLIGKTIKVTRDDDGTTHNDSTAKDADEDLGLITWLVWPDQENFPDHPMSVGGTWDASEALRKSNGLKPDDKIKATYKLDSVHWKDARRIAQISGACATTRTLDDNTESSDESADTLTVDVERGLIVTMDQTSSIKYATPPSQLKQMNGTSQGKFHYECQPLVDAPAQK